MSYSRQSNNQITNSSGKTVMSPKRSLPRLSLTRTTSSGLTTGERRAAPKGSLNTVRKSYSFSETLRAGKNAAITSADKISPRLSLSGDEKVKLDAKCSPRRGNIDVRPAWTLNADGRAKTEVRDVNNNINRTENNTDDPHLTSKSNVEGQLNKNQTGETLENTNNGATGAAKEKTESRTGSKWTLLKARLLENVESVREEIKNKNFNEEEKGEHPAENNFDRQSAMYWKLLRQRLRKCEPAEIIASSDVQEIQKRRQRKESLERRKSHPSMGRGSRFFQTVMQAQTLSKERNRIGSSDNKVYSLGTGKSQGVTSTLLKRGSLPEIGSSVKFKCSPHFHRTLKSLDKDMNDLFVIEDEER